MVDPVDQLLDQEVRGQVRRQRILDAAAACFVREGFHGASIARIAKAAGMSAGNLYHFFESKEAIIGALVQRKLDESLALFAQIENAEDLFQAMMERVEASLN
jgi:AcrR family transcriptional regulator